MAVLRLTYPEKTNNPSDADSIRKFFSTEANEIKLVTENHADEIENIKLALPTTSNPNYGIYSSLALLQLAHPVGELNAYATIDAGYGISPQIAIWDNVEEIWEISGSTTDKVFVANQAALPGPGTENIWYITLDKNEIFLWFNAQYNLMNPVGVGGYPKIIIGARLYELRKTVNVSDLSKTTTLETGDIVVGSPSDGTYVFAKRLAGGDANDINDTDAFEIFGGI